MLAIAARQWWVLVLQGLLGIAVGILAIIFPDLALATVALLFAVWAIVSGVSQLSAGWRVAEARGRSWPFLVSGAVSVIAGILAVLYPDVTILYLILLLGAWILISGMMEVYTAWRIRNEVTGEWVLALGGALRVIAGILILAMPYIGAILTAALFALWAILSGAGALFLGWRLRQMNGRMATAPPWLRHALMRGSFWQACAAEIPPKEWPNAPTLEMSAWPETGSAVDRLSSSRTKRMSSACHSSLLRLDSPSSEGTLGQRLPSYEMWLPSEEMVTNAS